MTVRYVRFALAVLPFVSIAAGEGRAAPSAPPPRHDCAAEHPDQRCAVWELPAARRTGTFGGVRLTYDIRLSRTVIHDAYGTASLVSTDYVVPNLPNEAERPVTFVFDGGPSVASALSQLGGMGPRRLVLPGQSATAGSIADNPDSPLDQTDLVFIDPVGTGFSRAIARSKPAAFWGVEQDSQSIADFIAAWTKQHHRESSPVLLLGTSYGGIRAIEVAHKLLAMPRSIGLRGIVLISGAIDFVAGLPQPGEDKGIVLGFPSMAALAWFYGKVDRKGRSLHTFLDQAQEFARGEYAEALFEGNRLSSAERDDVARKMSEFIGIDAATIVADNLRVRNFDQVLLKSQGRIIDSVLDGRQTYAAGRTPYVINFLHGLTAGMDRYLESELGVRQPDDYLERAKAKSWDWHFTYGDKGIPDVYLSGTGMLFREMQAHPRLTVFLAGGYFDPNVPYYETEFVAAHLPSPDRVTTHIYPGGHAVFLDPEARRAFSGDLRSFIRKCCER